MYILIEDNSDLNAGLSYDLEMEGYHVESALRNCKEIIKSTSFAGFFFESASQKPEVYRGTRDF